MRALHGLDERERRFAEAQGFKAEAGRHVLLPDADGDIGRVLFGLGAAGCGRAQPAARSASLRRRCRPATYRLAAGFDEPELSALAFALGGYRFDRYRKPRTRRPRACRSRTASTRAALAPHPRRRSSWPAT